MSEALRLLRRCEDVADARIGEPIYTDELCAAARVSPRKLHDAFTVVCGMSPHAYLKLRRLAQVRRALRASGAEEPLVKSVALAHGFRHLGRFSCDYRALFGETPSQTVAAARRDGRHLDARRGGASATRAPQRDELDAPV